MRKIIGIIAMWVIICQIPALIGTLVTMSPEYKNTPWWQGYLMGLAIPAFIATGVGIVILALVVRGWINGRG
jgi:branched-subunit amino acid permease